MATASSSTVYPYDVAPPNEEDLMSGPISSGVVTRKQKETYYVVKDINKRLSALKAEETFETFKVKLFTIAFLFMLAGILLILVGTHTSVLFAEQPFDPVAVAFGGLFCVPIIVWMKFMFVPSQPEALKRKSIKMERRGSKGPKLYQQITEAARKYAEPPPRRIKVTAVVRKKEYPVVASTWKSFCEEIEHQTGLPIERQIVKFRDEELKIDLKLKLDEHYGLDTGDQLYIYNRGGFTTANSPIRKQYEDMTNPNVDENKDDDTGGGNWMEAAMSAARNSFREKAKGKAGGGAGSEQDRSRSSGAGRNSYQQSPGSRQAPRSSINNHQQRKSGNVSFNV